ncbi:unnamed protein product, partial [Staurois parvus]
MLVILTVELKGLILCIVQKRLFDPDFLLPNYLLITHIVETLHMLSLVCIAREVFFLNSWESACNQHRPNQHCPDIGQGFCILL